MKKNTATKTDADGMIETTLWYGKMAYSYHSEALGRRVEVEMSMPFIWADTKEAAESALIKKAGVRDRIDSVSVRVVEQKSRCCPEVRTTL